MTTKKNIEILKGKIQELEKQKFLFLNKIYFVNFKDAAKNYFWKFHVKFNFEDFKNGNYLFNFKYAISESKLLNDLSNCEIGDITDNEKLNINYSAAGESFNFESKDLQIQILQILNNFNLIYEYKKILESQISNLEIAGEYKKLKSILKYHNTAIFGARTNYNFVDLANKKLYYSWNIRKFKVEEFIQKMRKDYIFSSIVRKINKSFDSFY